MKEVSVSLWEVSLEEITQLPKETHILIYYPVVRSYSVVRARQILALVGLSKKTSCFTFEKPNFKKDGEVK